jgi:hypothetical protein
MASDLVCNLTVDNTPYPVNLTSGGINTSIMFLGAGYHYWNVTCIDYVGQRQHITDMVYPDTIA